MPGDRLVPLRQSVLLQATTVQPWLVGLQIGGLATYTTVAADQSTAPITGVAGLRDTEPLTSPDGATQYYLPRYRLRSTGDVYSVRFEDGDDGRWWFRVVLDLVAAPELGETWRTAEVLPGVVTGRLTFGRPVAQTVGSGEQSDVAGGVALGFSLSLAERDALLWSLKSDEGASLVVVRSVRVAVPLTAERTGPLHWTPDVLPEPVDPPNVEPPPEPEPEPVPEPEPEPVVPRRRDHIPQTLPAYESARRLVGTPFVARLAAVDEPVRSAAAMGAERTPRAARRLTDADVFRPLDAVTTGGQLVRYVDAAPEVAVDLWFDPAVHPYVFPGAASGRPPTYERLQVPDEAGRSHAYLRDPAVPAVFWYLPDAFRLARTTTPPLRPALAFGLDRADDAAAAGGPGDDTVTLNAQVVPAVDPARLTAAAQALAGQVPERDGARAPVDLRPLQAPATLTLDLLSAPVDEATKAPLDLVNGFLLTGRFPFGRFQDVYAALAATGDVSGVLRGTVAVDSGLPGADVVPVELRFASAVGDVLSASSRVDRGALVVALRNASESPVRLVEPPVELAGTAAVVTGADYPLELPVDGSVELRLTPVAGPDEAATAPDPADLRLRPGAVVALSDPAAILALALDQRVDQEVDREVTVMTTAAKLAGDGSRPVETVVVELAGADAVTVDATTPRVTVPVPVPLVDVLLQRDGGGLVRYRQTLVTTAGDTIADTDWRTTDRSLLVVPVD